MCALQQDLIWPVPRQQVSDTPGRGGEPGVGALLHHTYQVTYWLAVNTLHPVLTQPTISSLATALRWEKLRRKM